MYETNLRGNYKRGLIRTNIKHQKVNTNYKSVHNRNKEYREMWTPPYR